MKNESVNITTDEENLASHRTAKRGILPKTNAPRGQKRDYLDRSIRFDVTMITETEIKKLAGSLSISVSALIRGITMKGLQDFRTELALAQAERDGEGDFVDTEDLTEADGDCNDLDAEMAAILRGE